MVSPLAGVLNGKIEFVPNLGDHTGKWNDVVTYNCNLTRYSGASPNKGEVLRPWLSAKNMQAEHDFEQYCLKRWIKWNRHYWDLHIFANKTEIYILHRDEIIDFLTPRMNRSFSRFSSSKLTSATEKPILVNRIFAYGVAKKVILAREYCLRKLLSFALLTDLQPCVLI